MEKADADMRFTGMSSHILTLDWPESTDILKQAHIETLARSLRYQALGRACFQHDIKSLLMAHHRGDQAETILFRLAWGHFGQGLQGINTFAQLPECFGMYGIYQSGSPLELEGRGPPDEQSELKMQIEGGGVTLVRPLISFGKERLIETCRSTGTSWMEDVTNQDVKLTTRNAIRHIFKTGQLPAALAEGQLLDLAARRNLWVDKRIAHAEKLFNSCAIRLDVRSGNLIVRFPQRVREIDDNENEVTDDDASAAPVEQMRYEAAELVRRVIELATPKKKLALSQLEIPLAHIFPETFGAKGSESGEEETRPVVAIAGLKLERLPYDLDGSMVVRGSGIALDPDFVWHISRLPFSVRDKPADISIPAWGQIADVHHEQMHEQIHEQIHDQPVPTHRTSFRLWDGRFWIRIRNPRPYPLRIRSLKVTDLKAFRNRLPFRERPRFNDTLAKAAPRSTRYTLPVVVDSFDNVLELPTLGLTHETDIWPASKDMGMICEVRYRNIDLGTHNSKAVLVDECVDWFRGPVIPKRPFRTRRPERDRRIRNWIYRPTFGVKDGNSS